MSDRKFTDDDVIKTLKNAKYKVDGVVTRGFYLSPETFNAVVDIIGRQEVEIERLTAERDNEHRCYLHICEDLKQAVNRNITAKSEAIKEFAERLKSDLGRIPQYHFTRSEVEWSINTLEKEMTEESK